MTKTLFCILLAIILLPAAYAQRKAPSKTASANAPTRSTTGDTNNNLRDQLVNNEKSLAQAQSDKQAGALQRMLDPNLIFVAFNGMVFTRQQLVSKVQYIDVHNYDMQNFKVRTLGGGAALLTYDLDVKASVAGHNLPGKEYASSVWVRRGNGWQLVFHQETPAHHS